MEIMERYRVQFIVALIVLSVFLGIWLYRLIIYESLSQRVSDQLQKFIVTGEPDWELKLDDENVFAVDLIQEFYQDRLYRPLWSDDGGPQPIVQDLLHAIVYGDHEGLLPSDYHLDVIEMILKKIEKSWSLLKKRYDPMNLAKLDLLLSDAFFVYASHLLGGRIDPLTIDPEWIVNLEEVDLIELLNHAVDNRQIEDHLLELLPKVECYRQLKKVLINYRTIHFRGGWPQIAQGMKLKKGDVDDRVLALRARLSATYDSIIFSPGDERMFDENLENALLRFQRENGLTEDGALGLRTLEMLNIPVEERILQIIANMERWRWLPRQLGDNYIMVNIAGFELTVIEASQEVINMRVIVGRNYRQTPIMSEKLTYLVLNPYWYVPPTIIIEDMVPAVRRDPNYFSKQNIKIFKGWGKKMAEVDPTSIDWSQINEDRIGYVFRQDPGLRNALGKVKFMFPNKHSVYLHDTPAPYQFRETKRDFSSGCIRVERPLELAEYLLKYNANWDREKILAVIEEKTERTIILARSIPVHLFYCTVWVDDMGEIHFREDIYGRDKKLAEALQKKLPISKG